MGVFVGVYATEADRDAAVPAPNAWDFAKIEPDEEGLTYWTQYQSSAWKDYRIFSEFAPFRTGDYTDDTEWRAEIGHEDYAIRIWNGTTTRFSVDDAGNAVFSGTLSATAIDIPDAVTAASFHVSTVGDMWLGATTFGSALFSIDSATGNVLNAGSFTLTGSGAFKTAASGGRLELSANQGDTLLLWDGVNNTSGALSVGTKFVTLIAPSATADGTNPSPTFNLNSGVPGSGNRQVNMKYVDRLLLEGTNTGAYIRLREMSSAPATPPASHLHLYVLDKVGVSTLYWKDDAGTEFDLSAAGGGGSVATDTIWDALGDTVYGSAADTGVRLAGNTTATRKFLRQVGNGTVSAAPAWDTLVAGDLPQHGAAEHTNTTRSLWFTNTQGLQLDGGAGANVGTSPNIHKAVALADAATQGVAMTFLVPGDYVSGGSFVIHWSPGATDATPHTVRWSLNCLKTVAGTDVSAAGTTTAFTGSSAARTVSVKVIEAAQDDGITVAAGEVMRANLQRVGADGADTYVGIVNVLGVAWSYTGDGS